MSAARWRIFWAKTVRSPPRTRSIAASIGCSRTRRRCLAFADHRLTRAFMGHTLVRSKPAHLVNSAPEPTIRQQAVSRLIHKPKGSATRLTILRGLRSRVEVKSRQNEAIRVDSGGEWHREREIVTKHRAIHRFSGPRCPSGSGKRWFEIPIHLRLIKG